MTDWPDANPFPERIADALRRTLDLSKIDAAEVEAVSRQIFAASELGRSDEHASNRPASGSASENELRKFHDLCGKLARNIEAMHNPALEALSREGLIARDLMRQLEAAQETARHAFGGLDDAPSPRGRPPEVEAAEVTRITAAYYEKITGRPPSRAVDDEGEYGGWIDALRAVFAALYIDASPEKQAQAYRTEIGQIRGN